VFIELLNTRTISSLPLFYSFHTSNLEAVFAIYHSSLRQMMGCQATIVLFLSLLILPSFGMQSPAANLGKNTPAISEVQVHGLSCIITGYTSQCIPDAYYQARERCEPNNKGTRCIQKVHTILGMRIIGWASHPETEQECQYCSCRQGNHRTTSESGREMVDRNYKLSMQTKEAAPAGVSASRDNPTKKLHDLYCHMVNRPSLVCKEAHCKRAGGRCLSYEGSAKCFEHIWDNGKPSPHQFFDSIWLPSCSGCRCAFSNSSPHHTAENLAGKSKFSEELPIASDPMFPSLKLLREEFSSSPNQLARKRKLSEA
jgi:hypothetical protein